MALLTTQQAAERIGVSLRHVQRLVAGGGLIAIGLNRIDAESVAQWMAPREGSRLRAWAEPTAWAAVALLEGEQTPWLGQAQRSRLRSALAGLGAVELVARTRNRAEVHRFHAHPRALGHLSRDVVGSGATQGIGGLTAVTDRLDGYLAASALHRVAQRYRLDPDPAGDITLRATDMPLDVVADFADGRRDVLAGLDLAGSTGHRILERAIGALRGSGPQGG